MKKVLLVPDSFKGTMSSEEICEIMARQIRRRWPEAEVVSLPVADGGEGSVDAFLTAVGGEKRQLTVCGPYGENVQGFYGILPDGTAVIEVAAAVGLPLAQGRRQVEKTTSYGVGQLIRASLDAGCRQIIVGLGGSATNDGGCGAACALGARFTDRAGTEFIPVGGTLEKMEHIDLSGMDSRLRETEIIAMCDIDNPLCGPLGAACAFAPQKGADAEMVRRLDAGLAHMAETVQRELGCDISRLHGAGAAGGMGGGMAAFFGGRLQMGIETVLDTVGFDRLLQGADLVFTGEGKIDFQSLLGKVVLGVARRTQKARVPLVAVVGDIGERVEAAYDAGVTAIFSINRIAAPYTTLRGRAREDLARTMEDILRLIQAFERMQA